MDYYPKDASLSSVGVLALLLSTENLFPWEVRHLWNCEEAVEVLEEVCFSAQLSGVDAAGIDVVVDVIVDVVVVLATLTRMDGSGFLRQWGKVRHPVGHGVILLCGQLDVV